MRVLLHIGNARQLGMDVGKLGDFVDAASLGYRDNPYHNWRHAVEVTHTAAWLATRPHLQELLLPREIFWLLISAIVHDLDHPGHSNHLEVATRSALAMRYNNQSVLENHSLEQALALLRAHDFRSAEAMAPNSGRIEDGLLRELIVATDPAGDVAFLASLADAVNRFCSGDWENRETFIPLLLMALLKIADMGASTLPFVQAAHWAKRAAQELTAEARLMRIFGLQAVVAQDDPIAFRRARVGCIDSSSLCLLRLINLIEPANRKLTASLLRNVALFRNLLDPYGRRLELGG